MVMFYHKTVMAVTYRLAQRNHIIVSRGNGVGGSETVTTQTFFWCVLLSVGNLFEMMVCSSSEITWAYHTHTLDKNRIARAIRWELNPKINKQVLEQNIYKIPELSTKSINKEIHEYMEEPE